MEIAEAAKSAETIPVFKNVTGGTGGGVNRITIAGSGDDNLRCSFYSCFACTGGHCSALNNTDFHGKPCPFYKSAGQLRKGRQDAFDRLLINGRLDLINRYEDILVDLGIEDPEDAKIPIDDDILAARAEMEEFKEQFADAQAAKAEASEEDEFLWDD